MAPSEHQKSIPSNPIRRFREQLGMSRTELEEKAFLRRGTVAVAEADGANPARAILGDIRTTLMQRAEEIGVELDIDDEHDLVSTTVRNPNAARLQRLLSYLPIIAVDVDDMAAILDGEAGLLLRDLARKASVEPSYVANSLSWLFKCTLEATPEVDWPGRASGSPIYVFNLLPDTDDVASIIGAHLRCSQEVATRYIHDVNETAWNLWVDSDSDQLPR